MASLLNKSSESRCLKFSNGFNSSKSLILLPDKFRWVSSGALVVKLLNPDEILKIGEIWLDPECQNASSLYEWNSSLCWETHLLSDSSNFFSFGSFGKPFNVVSPTFIKLSVSNAVNSSVRPTIFVLRQLSKFKSVICKMGKQFFFGWRS